jgi:hypothetical protein
MFLRLLEAAELQPHASTSVGFAYARGNVVGHLPLDVVANLEIEPLVSGASP